MYYKYSCISFCLPEYEERGETEDDRSRDISDVLRILLKNGYQCRIWDDGMTICVEYNHLDESMSGVSLEWLGEDEYIGNYNDETEA